MPTGEIAVLAGVTLALIAVSVWIGTRLTRSSPEKREQRRRKLVNQTGRLGDAFITEANEAAIYYEYSVQGVQYTASQDIAGLRHL